MNELEIGNEPEGIWAENPDVLRLKVVLRKHGIDHSGQTIWDTWGDYCEKIYCASWLGTEGYSEDVLFAVYYGFFCGLITHHEEDSVVIDIVQRIAEARKGDGKLN